MYILVLALVLFALYILINMINLVVDNYQRQKFFKINSPRLPVVPRPNIILGNIGQTTWHKKNYDLIDKWHNKLGRTFGYYYLAQPWVSTTDINLIKKVMMDDASKHLSRAFINIPVKEFNDSLAQITGNEWRQVRRALAPTLT